MIWGAVKPPYLEPWYGGVVEEVVISFTGVWGLQPLSVFANAGKPKLPLQESQTTKEYERHLMLHV